MQLTRPSGETLWRPMTWDGSGSDLWLQYRTYLLGIVKRIAVHHAAKAKLTLR